MFEYLLNFGARLDIKNRQNFTPLTLAAKLGKQQIFGYILKKIRKVYWIYGNITCAGELFLFFSQT
jgi:transient receptor potential cation channel subfamily V protein 5